MAGGDDSAALSRTSGLFEGLLSAQNRDMASEDADKKAAKAALAQMRGFQQQDDLLSRRQSFQSDQNDKNRILRDKLAAGGGGSYKFGEIFGLDQSDPRYNIMVTTKQAPSVAAASVNASKPSASEAKATGDASQMSSLGTNLGAQWKEFGFDKPTLGQAGSGVAAQYLPGQLSQRMLDPKYKQFDDTKKILSETSLRIATGAATNPSEVSTYKAFLPEPGDLPQIAANKINNFFTRVNEKGEDTARRLEAQGQVRAAAAHRKAVSEKLEKMKAQMLQDFGGAPAPIPTTAPAPGAGAAPQGYDALWGD